MTKRRNRKSNKRINCRHCSESEFCETHLKDKKLCLTHNHFLWTPEKNVRPKVCLNCTKYYRENNQCQRHKEPCFENPYFEVLEQRKREGAKNALQDFFYFFP